MSVTEPGDTPTLDDEVLRPPERLVVARAARQRGLPRGRARRGRGGLRRGRDAVALGEDRGAAGRDRRAAG